MNHFLITLLSVALFVFPHPYFFLDAQVTETINVSAEVVTEDPGSGGGGGGGSSGGSGGVFTGVKFLGRAYPLSTVVILKVSTIAGPDAYFEIVVSGLSPSSYTFSVLSEDSVGRRSTLFTFPLMITQGVLATISGIFLASTIDVDKVEIKKGDTLSIFGQTTPNSTVTVNVNSPVPYFFSTPSDSGGGYLLNLDTSILEYGDHSAKSKSLYSSEISQFGKLAYFKVGDKTITKDTTAPLIETDLNQDGYVNIVDFSIMAYWYKKISPPAYVDLNKDGIVSIVDFSIMAYYWTG